MQKKIYTGILLVAVIAIWGYVGYTFINGMSSREEETVEETIPETNATLVNIKPTEQLNLNYADPFLKNDYVVIFSNAPKKTNEKPRVKTDVPKTVTTTTFVWPSVTYKGIIKNQSKPDKILGLVVIDGKEHLVKKGDKISNITVLNIEKSNLQLIAENNKQVFLLSH